MHIKQLIITIVALSLNAITLHTSASEFPVPDQPGVTFDFYEHRLPEGPLRSFLKKNLSFDTQELARMENRRPQLFKNMGGSHGLVGTLPGHTFPGSNSPVFIKAAYPYQDEEVPPFVYSHKQNISRLPMAMLIADIIQKKHLTCFAPLPRKFIYPLSGNDNDLKDASRVSDINSIILAEGIDIAQEEPSLTIEMLKGLKEIVIQTGAADIACSQNIAVDLSGKLVIFDTENFLIGYLQDSIEFKIAVSEGICRIGDHAQKEAKEGSELYQFGMECMQSFKTMQGQIESILNAQNTHLHAYCRWQNNKRRKYTAQIYDDHCRQQQRLILARASSLVIGVIGVIFSAIWWCKQQEICNIELTEI